MYHTNELNQVFQTNKSLISTGLSPKHSQAVHFTGDTEQYITSCTSLQQQIAHLFLKYRNAPYVKLTNNYIALSLNCSTKTVTRATNKFLEDGFITKHQANRYAPNEYTFNDKVKKGKHAFAYWFNSLSPANQELYMTHGIRIDHKNKVIFSLRNVPQNNNLILRESLFINSSPSSRRREGSLNKKSKEWIMKEAPKPKTVPKKKSPLDWEPPKVDPLDVRIAQLQTKVPKSEKTLETYTAAPWWTRGYLERIIRQDKQELVDLQYEQILANG